MGGLQEMDHPQLFHSITRLGRDRLADRTARRLHRHRRQGRLLRTGWPVFLDVPMDVQFDMVDERSDPVAPDVPGGSGSAGRAVRDR